MEHGRSRYTKGREKDSLTVLKAHDRIQITHRGMHRTLFFGGNILFKRVVDAFVKRADWEKGKGDGDGVLYCL